MARWLAVDTGDKRMGLAVGSDEDGIATPLEVIAASPLADAIETIRQVAGSYGVDGIVVGLPLNMDDTVGPQAQAARAIAVAIAEATGMDVRLWDERLSSFEADQSLAGQLTRGKRRKRQDAVAAATFLTDFLAGDGPGCSEKVSGDP
jgi:putative Holliday junction resolvase